MPATRAPGSRRESRRRSGGCRPRPAPRPKPSAGSKPRSARSKPTSSGRKPKRSGKLKALQLAHEEELQREREAKERAIAAAEERLNEIEAQAEAAEERVAAAEERAARSEREVEDERVRARESAATWLRGQLDALRREGG